MPNPKVKSIYDALKGGGADVGTEQEFNDWFFARGDQGYKNRKYVYDTMKEGGADMGKNYEEFRDWLGLHAVKPQKAAPKQQAAAPSSTVETAKQIGWDNWAQPFDAKTAGMPTAFQTPGAGAVISPQTGKPVKEEVDPAVEAMRRFAAGKPNEEDIEKSRKRGQQLKDELDYARETGGKRLQDGNLINMPGQVNTVARDAEGNILKNENGQVIKGVTNDETRVLTSGRFNEDVDKRLAEDENLKALKEGIEKQLLQTKDNGNEGFAELAIAHKAVNDAEELMREMNKQKRGSSFGDFFRNVWRGLKSENMFSVADDLTNNVHVMSAIDKYQSDPSSLTDAEKILLDAVAFKNVIDQEYNPQMSRAAKAGQTTGGSITLMADIAMNPLSGLGKSMAKKVGTKVLRNAAEKAAASGAERAISKGAARAARFAAAGGNLAGNIVSAAGMTATIGAPRVISDAQQRMIGDIQSEYDENGLLHFTGAEGGDNAFDAYRKAFVSNAIENFTEIQSSMLLGAVGLAGRTIPGVRSAMNGFKATALGQMWNAAGRSQLGRMARNVAERTGLHDFPGESLEEIEGGILNALFVGDQTIADTFEQDNLIDIGLGVAPMQFFFAAVNMGGYGAASRRAKSKLREADADGHRFFGEEGWQQMKQTIDNTKDVNELKNVLSNVVNGGQYSTQAKQAAFRYAAAREGYKGAVLGEAAARELDFGKKSRVESFTVDGNTVTTFDKEGKELEKKTFENDDEVQAYMTEVKMRRKNDDMLSDIETLQKKATQREAIKGEVGYTAAFTDDEWTGLMWEAMQKAGYDESKGVDDPVNQAIAANVTQVGTAENDIFKEVVNSYNPLQRLHHNIAESYGISDGELQRILDKDPLRRTDEQQHIVDVYAEQLHAIAYEPGELHTEQSAQDGASAADDADGGTSGINPEVLRTEKERYDAAIAARDEALKNNQAMAMRVEELQSYGVDPAGIVAELSDFDENDVKAVVEGYNAEYRWQSFLDKANQNFEATTQREVDRRTFKGTINGAAQTENMVTITDGQNIYTLSAGDVTTDADGRVTGGGNANALVALDAEGNMVVLHPESTLTVAPGENLAEWGATFLQQLQEGSTEAAGIEQPAAETGETEAPEAPEAPEGTGGAATQSQQTGQGENQPVNGTSEGKTSMLKKLKETFKNKIKGWLTDENIEWAEGKDFNQVKEQFGNNPEPIAVMPDIVRKNIPSLNDDYLYCGKAYLIDHHANHHPEIEVEEYDNIQEILDNYDDIKDLSEGGKLKIAFIKKLDKGYAVVAELSKEDNRIILHKTFFYKDSAGKRIPYKNKPSILEKWSADGSTTISPAEVQQPADTENISALDQSSEGKDTNNSGNGQENSEKNSENVIPTNEKGRKLYHQGVDLDVAIDDILKEEAPDNDVNALANRRIKTAQRKLDDLNKDNKKLAKQFEDKDFDDDEYDDVRAAQRGEELPYGTKLGQYAQERMEQEKIIDYYNKLKSRYAARKAMEILAAEGAGSTGATGATGAVGTTGSTGSNGNNGSNEPAGEENVPDWTVDKASDARARGYRMENGHRVDRNSNVYGEDGAETEVKFDKAEEPVKGKWVVFDEVDGFLTPSHVNGQRNVRYFITEAQPKERTDADSDNSSTAIAEHVNPEEITGGVTAYTGAPVVNARGEVIQGNNRTIGLQKMWGNDAYGESQQKYKQYLMEHAEEFGLDAAAIGAMEKPVLVRMVDVSDDEAIRLGQKTAANTESGGVERIDANRVLNQMGDKFDTFVRLLFAGAEDEDMTLMGMIVKNGVSVLKWLNDGRNHAKFITDTEYQSCFDKKNNLTEEAKQDLQKIVEGMLFADAPDNLRDMFYRMPAKAQNAILATFFRDAQSPKEASIIKDIQNAIEAFETISNASPEFKAAKVVNDARVAVKDVQKQTSMFGNTGTILEKFDNFALELAILFKGAKQNTLRDYFNAYYDAVQGKGGDMFNEAVTKTKPEAIKEIFGIETNNQEDNGQEGNGSLESGSNDGTGGQPGNAGESGNGEPPAEGGGSAVGGGGTAGTGEVSEREQYIADHPLTEEEIDTSDAPKMRKNLAKGYLNGSNESALAQAAYTSIYNKKGKTEAPEAPEQPTGETEVPETPEAPEQPTGEAPQGEAPRGEQPAAEKAGDEGLSEATKAARDRVQAILARMKKHGNQQKNDNADAYSITGLTDEQIDDMLELVEAGAELGYTLLDGVQTKDEWTVQMRGLIGESLKDATGYTDAEVDELLEDLWNAPYENEWGDTNTIAEYAAEKGITTTNNNDNGTEEGNGEGDSGVSGSNTVGGSTEVGVGETGNSTGSNSETGNGEVVPGTNQGANGGTQGTGAGVHVEVASGTGEGEGTGDVGAGVPGQNSGTVRGNSSGAAGNGKPTNGGTSNGSGQTNNGGGIPQGGATNTTPESAPSVGQPERVTPQQPLADISKEKAPYVPASIGGKHAIGSVVPSGVADAIAQAFKRLREQHKKEVLDFVRDELGYSSNEEMLSDFDSEKTDGLAAEQVDSVALAISAMKSGKSFIVGDMTGVGKGRTAAALIRWGKKQGKKVLFVTKGKGDLFSDMYGDLTDIGCDYLPFVTNDNKEANITDNDGNKVVPKPSPKLQSATWQREDDVLPTDKKGRQYDFVMTTYSQVGSNTTSKKAEWLKRYAKDAIVIMDESHNASGESNTGEFFKGIVKDANGVTFLSATYAKRPDNMLLYALRSSMSETHMSTEGMLQAIKDYGVPMQEIMAAALYGSGEMIRRERDMSDVKTTWTDPKVIYSEEEYEQCRKTSDKTMNLVNDIIDFQREFVNPIVKKWNEDHNVEKAKEIAILTGQPYTAASNTSYKTQVSNVVNIMTYSMKARKAAQIAIEQIKQGKRPVIAVDNTLDSYIKELPSEIASADFGPVFRKGVGFSLKYVTNQYVIKNGKPKKVDDTEVVFDAEQELDENGRKVLENLRNRIKAYVADKDKVDLTLSPIDLIKQMIADAGYNCGEITGRSTQLERMGGGGFRKTPIRIKRREVARKFNGGSVEKPLPENEQYQALILNTAGSTGISLHSSKTFGNQSPRTMIILQPAKDVSIEVQMRGRIDRTGQVHRGEYFYLTSPIPAEQKMTMMLKQKLASLDAQSVGTKDVSSNKVEGQDMNNKYGDQVCYDFLMGHRYDVNIYLEAGITDKEMKDGTVRDGLLYDVLKDIQRMSCDMQEMVINELTQRYADHIEYLNQNGINDLETTTKNLEAVTIDKAVFVKGKDNDSINEFAHDTTIERVEVNVLKKPMRSSDIKKKMKDLNALDEDGLPKESVYTTVQQKVQDVAQKKYDDRKEKFDKQEAKLEEKIRKEHPKKEEQTDEEWEEMIKNWPTLLEMQMKHKEDLSTLLDDLEKQKNAVSYAALYLKPGRPYLVPLTDDVSNDSMSMYGRFLGFQTKNGDPRQVQAVFAVKDSRAIISVPVVNQNKVIQKILNDRNDTEILALQQGRWGSELPMEERAKNWDEWWDKMIPKNTSREIRFMITGNVLQACGNLGKYKGQIVTFTRKNKDTGEITLERGMLLAENFDPENFKIRRAVTKEDVWGTYGEVEDQEHGISCSHQGSRMIVKFKQRGREKLANHPVQKDDVLKKLAINESIYAYGRKELACDVAEENVEKVLEHLYKEYGYTKEELFVMPDSTEKPDAIVRSNRPYQEVIDELSPKYGNSYYSVDYEIRKRLKRYKMDVNNDTLKAEIREAVQLRQAYLRKSYANKESNRLAWQVLIEDQNIKEAGDDKEYRERHMRIREAILEELDFRNFKGNAYHYEQGQITLDDVRQMFDKMNDESTSEGKAKKALFEKVMAKVSKLPMEIFMNEKLDNNTGGYAGGKIVNYNWKYMNADYIADQAKADTILHELIHTVTAYADRCVDDGLEHLLDQDMVDAINELKSILASIENDPTFVHDGEKAYGLTNVREMLSEAGSNSEFRADLKKTGLWAKLKSGFLKFFGIKSNVEGGKKVVAYDEIMDRLDFLIENFNQEAWEKYYRGTSYGGYGYQRFDAQRVATESQQTQQRIEDDVEQNGLRGAVGDESYRKYMRDLWTSKGNQEMHQWVTEHLAENGFNLYDTIDKYLKQAAENGEGSQEMWENVRDGLKEATGEKRMSLREARWLSWLSGRKGDRSNPDDSMKKSAVRWRIGRRRDMARLTEDKHSYAGIGPDVDMTDEMAFGNTPSTNLAKLWYHRQLDNWATQWTEAHVDYAVSMKKLMFALTGAREVFDVADDENFYVAENHMSSIITQREFQFMRDYWTPLQNAVDACLPDLDSDVEKAMSALEDYMRAKHGLERNREFFVRDWLLAAEKAQQRGLKNAPTIDVEQLREDWETAKRTAWSSMLAGRMTYRQYLAALDDFIKREVDADWDSSLLKNDKSGLRNYAHQTDDAFEEDDVISDVEDMERVLGDKATALWDAINDVTDYSLDSDYESGLISKENREHVGKMFHFYVPLRGFNEKVANEVYDYMGIPISNPVGLATLMKAKGRKSLSDSPLAVMGAMSTSAISRGERNKVKQKLLRLVRNHYNAKDKDRLVSLSKIWLENIGTEDNPIWEERWPEFDENDSADEIVRKVEDFNTDMEKKRANGMAMPRRANLNIPYRAKEAEKRQHMVEVKENGESYLVIINGDPRAAQAMNGLLTPGNADKNHSLGLRKKVISPVNRFLSSAFTTWNPTFVLRNTLRDAIMSRSVVLTKEGEGYLMRFRANWYKLLWPELLNGRLWKKYRKGTLDESNFLEKCFKEFMEGGGETGYVEQKNVDKWRKMLLDGSKEYARKHGGLHRRAAYSTSQVAKAAIGLIEDYNERAENLARFATYLTSRQMGRTQLRSVADAKDVSVNFNRKGAGGSSADKNFLAGTSAELFKSLYLFFNAGMQSLALMSRNIKKHPMRFMRAQFANHFVMGVTIVMLNKWLVSVLGDDDTAENPYANLPEWTRRNNLCFFVGGNDWVTIPLPIELRAFYGLGDIAAGYFIDPELKSLKSPAEDFVAQLSQILPVDFMGEGGDVLSAFVPDAVKPLTQVKNNKDWTGKPIQKKESEWNKYDPEWTKAFRSTDKNVVGAARWLSNVTGGDDVKPGKIDISPAYALHILKGYTGGLGQTVTEAGGLIRDVAKWDFEDFNMRNVPLAKAVYNQSDERTAYYRTRAKFYKYVEDTKKSKHYINGYKKSAEDPMYRAELIRMMQKDSLKNLIIDNAQKDLKKLQKAANQSKTGVERKQFEQYQYRVQEQAVKAIEGME